MPAIGEGVRALSEGAELAWGRLREERSAALEAARVRDYVGDWWGGGEKPGVEGQERRGRWRWRGWSSRVGRERMRMKTTRGSGAVETFWRLRKGRVALSEF